MRYWRRVNIKGEKYNNESSKSRLEKRWSWRRFDKVVLMTKYDKYTGHHARAKDSKRLLGEIQNYDPIVLVLQIINS